MAQRRITKLESDGAEFLVVGSLLRRGIQAYICSRNFENYDVIAVNPDHSKVIRIQVKSRFSNNAVGFPMKKVESDFTVLVKLNCGKGMGVKFVEDYMGIPEYWVIPTNICARYRNNLEGGWHKLMLSKIPNYNQYKDGWDAIKEKLK